jgi:hypothetical protein
MMDITFRDGLQKVIEENPRDDAVVIRFVLDYAWDQYPRPFFIWLNRNMRDYDMFGGA